jgi:hypothetical protein
MLRVRVTRSLVREERVDEQLSDEEARARGITERSRYSRRGMVGTIVKPIYRHVGNLVHRRTYHEDGSQTDAYTIELERDAFLEAGGVEVGTVHDQAVVTGANEAVRFGQLEYDQAERVLRSKE